MSADSPIESFIYLVQDTLASCRNDPTAGKWIERLENFKSKRLIPIHQRTKKAAQKTYILSLIGLTNVGKSTLMEALLGVPAPRKNGPATAIPVEYWHDDVWSLQIISSDITCRNETFPDVGQLSARLREVVFQDPSTNPDAATQLVKVKVKCPVPLLRNGLVMADTPGFGAAQTGEDNGMHQRILENFIQEKIDRIYFCIAAGETWSLSDVEKAFYQKIAHLCSHVIVTKWEGNEPEKEQYRSHYKNIFPSATFVYTNAKRAIQKNTPDGYGLTELKNIMDEYETPQKRMVASESELPSAWIDLYDYIEALDRTSKIPWRPDSLLRFAKSLKGKSHLESLLEKVERSLVK